MHKLLGVVDVVEADEVAELVIDDGLREGRAVERHASLRSYSTSEGCFRVVLGSCPDPVGRSKVDGKEVVRMQAKVGDRLVVESRSAETHRHEGEIVAVQGENGGPPYVVRWQDGHEGLTYPGPDAHVVGAKD